MVNFDYDCSGWATKANTKCYDGLTIAEDAFKDCSGQTVPMVYNHDHSSLDNVIGHALLENRKGGVYAYAKFNDTPTGQTAKKCVENGDLNAFSIWANGLQKAGQVVKHGVIRELSLVLAGCNPGALIQEVVKHSADNMDDEGCEAFIFNDPGSLSLEHGMDPEGNPLEEAVLAHSDDNKEDGKMAEETNGKTLEEVYNSMTDEQKECCHALVGLALEEQDGDGGEDEEDESDMKHNVFDKDAGKQTVLKHSIDDINSIIKGAKTSGTLKAAFDNAGVEQGEIDELSHGIDNIDWLFPEDHLLDTTPRIIDKPDDWVSVVMGGVKHIPFSRFKSMFADLTPEDARAKGYVKGNYKIEEVFGLLRRSTGPTTVYKKQKLDRDDVSDITSFDVVAWLRNEMSASLLVLAPAIQLIGMAKPEAVSQSLWIFADTMMAMFAGGMLLTCIPELALGLSTLAGAFAKFGKGMLYLAGAGALFGTLALFAGPLCTAIINAAPDIEDALVAVVTLICNAINQSAEPIGEAFTTLCKVLIQTAIDLIGWAWSGEGGEGDGIKGALEELGKNIWDGIRDIFSPFSDNGNFQQRNVAFKFNPDFKPQRINVADVFTFSGAKDDAEKEGKEIGGNVANGGAKGVEENKARATAAVQGMVDDTIDAAKKGYDINSPSKVFEEIGQYITEGLAIGIQDPGALSGALAAMQTVAKSIRSVFTTFWGIHSPSQLAEEDGRNVVEGLRLGIGDPDLRSQLYDASYDSASQVRDAVGAALDEAKKTASDKMLELYSIMKADRIMPDGTLPSGKAGLGANRYQQAVQDYEKANAKEDARNTPYLGADWKPSTMWDKATEALQKYQSGEIKAKDALKGLTGEAKDWVSKQIGSALGLEGLDPSEYADLILEQYSGYLPDDSTGASTASSGKKSSSKGKTLAETIADKYTKELKANKYLQNAADKEYSLWEAGEGNTASIEALIQKKGETLAKSIELQTARVDIAQRQYDELVSRVGASDDKTKEAYNTLLDEKKNLLDLQQARFENTYKAAIERYESDDKVAQSEYQLWADTYEKTASVTEKSNKNIEAINKRLATQSEKTALAEKAWVETKDALGEASLVTQQAYRDYLEARQEQLELENELDKAQLAAFDDLSSFYDSRISMVQKRMNLLDKLYNDGDLSGREDAYASAVEQYGEDSIEARRAATQGTMTALMGVNSALTSMRWQMSKVTAMQQKYQTALEQAGGNRYDETVMAAYEDMMETRSTFADYVGNLADALNVSDATKKAMMQFGDAIAQNWKPIQNGFMAVAKKMNPKLVQGFSDLFGLYMKDGASETVAAATNTVVAAMSGDWASAVASGLTAVLDVVGTDFGQTLTEAISTALKNAFSGNGMFAQLLMKLLGSIDLGGSGSSGGFLSNIWQWLKGAASAAKSFLGGASKAAAGASGAAKIIPVLGGVGTSAKGAAVGAKTAANALGLAGKAVTTVGTKAAGILGTVGGGIAKVAASLGPHGLLAAAVIAGTVAVGTAVVKNWDKVKEAIGNAWSWIKEKASGLWDGMKSIGGNLMSGLATGVKSTAKFVLKVALSPAYAIISGFKHILGIHSPSKVMAGIGESST